MMGMGEGILSSIVHISSQPLRKHFLYVIMFNVYNIPMK